MLGGQPRHNRRDEIEISLVGYGVEGREFFFDQRRDPGAVTSSKGKAIRRDARHFFEPAAGLSGDSDQTHLIQPMISSPACCPRNRYRGTKIAAGVVERGGRLLASVVTPTRAADVTRFPSHNSITAIDQLMSEEISAIGICSPGPLNPKTGVVINPPNLPDGATCSSLN